MVNTGIIFKKDTHEYFNSNNKKYTGVTTCISKYKTPFNKPFWTFYKAVQYKLGISDENKKIFSKMFITNGGDSNWNTLSFEPLIKICVDNNIQIEAIIADKKLVGQIWDIENKKSTDRGTRYHDRKEEESYSNNKDSIGNTTALTVKEYTFNLKELRDGFHAELMLYNHEYEMAGQMDKCIITTDIMGDRWVEGDDYKTNKKIDIVNPMGKKMLYPLNHLDDCNYIHYCLQLNSYLFMLKCFGFKIKLPSRFTHVLLNDKEEEIGTRIYTIPDLQREVQMMFEHNKKRNV